MVVSKLYFTTMPHSLKVFGLDNIYIYHGKIFLIFLTVHMGLVRQILCLASSQINWIMPQNC